MPRCMFDFRLDDDGQIELAEIGEATDDCIMEVCYPELDNAFATAEWDETDLDYSAKGRERIRVAVELERTRLRDSHPAAKGAETGLGREIQRQTGAPSTLVNRTRRLYNSSARRRIL